MSQKFMSQKPPGRYASVRLVTDKDLKDAPVQLNIGWLVTWGNILPLDKYVQVILTFSPDEPQSPSFIRNCFGFDAVSFKKAHEEVFMIQNEHPYMFPGEHPAYVAIMADPPEYHPKELKPEPPEDLKDLTGESPATRKNTPDTPRNREAMGDC